MINRTLYTQNVGEAPGVLSLPLALPCVSVDKCRSLSVDLICQMSSCADVTTSGVLTSVFIFLLLVLGCLGLGLNILVIKAVRRNKKLSTSINDLLVWICFSSSMEASLGIAAKILIIGNKMTGYHKLGHATVGPSGLRALSQN